MKTHDMLLNTDEFRLPVETMSNYELSKEHTRLTGQVALPPNAPDTAEIFSWRLSMERKVKVARRWHDINIRS
jgi:hypothetical protein